MRQNGVTNGCGAPFGVWGSSGRIASSMRSHSHVMRGAQGKIVIAVHHIEERFHRRSTRGAMRAAHNEQPDYRPVPDGRPTHSEGRDGWIISHYERRRHRRSDHDARSSSCNTRPDMPRAMPGSLRGP